MKRTIVYIYIIVVLSGCIRHKDLAYLQGAKYQDPYLSYRTSEYKIQPSDNLIVKMTSFDDELSGVINQSSTGIALTDPKGFLYFNSYTVSGIGEINLPLLGDFFVKDLTIHEIKDKIEEELKEYVKFPSVNVKLSNYQVTILGEVKSPGLKYYYDSKLTIFQAIGLAQDLTPFADRRKVKLIRETPNGTIVTPLDLTKPNIMESDYYFLRPNDVIYIEPSKARSFSLNKSNVELIASILTLGVLIVNVTSSGN